MSEDYNEPGCGTEVLLALAMCTVFWIGVGVLLLVWLL